ncbi:amyloid-beta A4 precursor protein-binding family A member 1 [Hypanus sabinus]|uniref:amyloid-beta A4 precursor protein-binding family A member 1 n=1 Tax=Hypanus sabinus TaxID=79690 RepID=UPI0028C42CA5|nr:amyloid-beta A4 precursor protein-binding family A member 1 [Hypanus sabinus]
MNRQEDPAEPDSEAVSLIQHASGVEMYEQGLENDQTGAEAVLPEVGDVCSLEILHDNRDAFTGYSDQDFCDEGAGEVIVSKDVNGEQKKVDNVELNNVVTKEVKDLVSAVHLSDLNADSESNLIEFGVKNISLGTDTMDQTSDLEDDDHCQIKLLSAQLRQHEQAAVVLEKKRELTLRSSVDGWTDLSVREGDRQQFGMINHQDILTDVTCEHSMPPNEKLKSLNGKKMDDLVQNCNKLTQDSCLGRISGFNDHAPSNIRGDLAPAKTESKDTFFQETSEESFGSDYGQTKGIIGGLHLDQQAPDFLESDDVEIEDFSSSSLVGRLLLRQMMLKEDWKKEGEALSLAVKELKEEVDCISKSFLPEDDPEHVDPLSQGACHIKTNDHERTRETKKKISFPAFKEVQGPCESEDLLDGIIFAASYLGSTQLFSEKNPSTNVRMSQAQEAVGRVKAPEGESQPMTAVDLFISTQRIKVLNAETQEALMDHPLQTISYIADIGTTIVFMARRRLPRKPPDQENRNSMAGKREYKMICHVFESEDASLIAQAIGQAFTVAYQQFLNANGINPADLSPNEYNDLLDTEFYNGDLVHFSKSENSKEVHIEKAKGEILGLVIVESGWGSILPTVVIANLMHGGPAERSGELNIGDQIISVNGTSLVGLPLATCQSIIKDLKYQFEVKLNIVRCPPVTTAIIKRPDLKHQLGFSVQDGIIYSLMRGGIAERGGIRVGHRIIEINGQSVVAIPHNKIVQRLSDATGEIHIKTMPAATYRLLTGQEQPIYI